MFVTSTRPAARDPSASRRVVDDDYLRDLAAAVGGELGGRTGIAPRLFLKKLVADVLDRVDLVRGLRPTPRLPPHGQRRRADDGGAGSARAEQPRSGRNVDEIDLDL